MGVSFLSQDPGATSWWNRGPGRQINFTDAGKKCSRLQRSEVHEPGFPDGISVIGSDDGAGTFTMMYFDERGTSRRFEVTTGEGRITWRRDDPQLAQDYILLAEGKDRLVVRGRISENGGPWADDLSQVFFRVFDGT